MTDDTIQSASQSALERPFLNSGMAFLDLSTERLVPIGNREFRIEPEGDLRVRAGSAHLRVVDRSLEVIRAEQVRLSDGTPLKVGMVLRPGDHLVAAEETFQLVECALQYHLQCLTQPFRDRIWPVGYQPQTLLGRKGLRLNDVEINEATVSRRHAIIERDSEAGLTLHAEHPLHLNGGRMLPGQSQTLRDGDLIRLGDLLFCYQTSTPANAAVADSTLRLHSLGCFELSVAGARCTGPEWNSQKLRFLLAYLAIESPQPVAVESLLETFWPNSDLGKARNSLRTSLSRLRSMIDLPGDLELFERSSHTVAFHPGLTLWHDVSVLRSLLTSGRIRQALELYRGRFLEDCDMEWSIKWAQRIESELQDSAQTYVTNNADRGERLEVAERILEIDPVCQWACRAQMEALRQDGRYSEALRLFERFERVLIARVGLEPTTDLLRERQLALLEIST